MRLSYAVLVICEMGFSQALSHQLVHPGEDPWGPFAPPGCSGAARGASPAWPLGGAVSAQMEALPLRVEGAGQSRPRGSGGCEGRAHSWDLPKSQRGTHAALKQSLNPIAREGEKERKKPTRFVCYSFIRDYATCQSSSTSIHVSGKAAQKEPLLLKRTGLVLFCHWK